MDIVKRCHIHAGKMDGEGWYVTANVLSLAADEIEHLRKTILFMTQRVKTATAPSSDDGQPTEQQEWHDYDPMC